MIFAVYIAPVILILHAACVKCTKTAIRMTDVISLVSAAYIVPKYISSSQTTINLPSTNSGQYGQRADSVFSLPSTLFSISRMLRQCALFASYTPSVRTVPRVFFAISVPLLMSVTSAKVVPLVALASSPYSDKITEYVQKA